MKYLQLEPSLMPHQVDFVMDDKTPVQGFVGGYRSGKSVAGVWKSLRCATELFPGEKGVIMAPIAGMNQTNIVPILRKILPTTGLDYDKDQLELERCYRLDIKIGSKISSIYLDVSAENPKRMVGRSLAWGYFDEADVCRTAQLATDGFIQLGNRLSEAEHPLLFATSTPEGYGMMYNRFVKQLDENTKIWHVDMRDNFLLPKNYIEGQLRNIPAHKQDAYIRGMFSNVFTSTVYKCYDRHLNNTTVTLQEAGQYADWNIGMDFNIEHTAAIFHVLENGEPRAVFELVNQYDTDACCIAIKAKQKELGHKGRITVYPDASGKNRNASGPSTSHAIIRGHGFKLKVPNRNPGVHKDLKKGDGNRVNTMNSMFHNGLGQRRYKVNTDMCPTYVESLEQQGWVDDEPDKSNNIDHPLDAGGYYIHEEFSILGKPTFRNYS